MRDYISKNIYQILMTALLTALVGIYMYHLSELRDINQRIRSVEKQLPAAQAEREALEKTLNDRTRAFEQRMTDISLLIQKQGEYLEKLITVLSSKGAGQG